MLFCLHASTSIGGDEYLNRNNKQTVGSAQVKKGNFRSGKNNDGGGNIDVEKNCIGGCVDFDPENNDDDEEDDDKFNI